MLNRRLQILLDDARYRRLEAEARRRKIAVAEVVRDAIDKTYPVTSERKRQAAKSILAAEPMDVPDVRDLKQEIDDLRGRHAGRS